MDVNNIVASNIKEMRKKKKLTLDSAAALTGVSRSMLAQIEKGDVNPTISVLWKIANGYKVSFTSLLEKKTDDVTVIKREEQAPLKEDGGRYLNYPVFAFNEKTSFETYRIVIEPCGKLSAQPHLSGAEEYITVFAGKTEITVDNESFVLSKGDSIRFFANVEHTYRNVGSEAAELSMLIFYHKR